MAKVKQESFSIDDGCSDGNADEVMGLIYLSLWQKIMSCPC